MSCSHATIKYTMTAQYLYSSTNKHSNTCSPNAMAFVIKTFIIQCLYNTANMKLLHQMAWRYEALTGKWWALCKNYYQKRVKFSLVRYQQSNLPRKHRTEVCIIKSSSSSERLMGVVVSLYMYCNLKLYP